MHSLGLLHSLPSASCTLELDRFFPQGQAARARACALLDTLVGERPTPELQFLELQAPLLHALCTYARFFGALDVETAPAALGMVARLLPLVRLGGSLSLSVSLSCWLHIKMSFAF